MGSFLIKYKVVLCNDLLICVLFFLTLHQTFADSNLSFKLSDLGDHQVTLNQNWKFHPGDNPSWSDLDFDDSHWSPVDPTTDIHYLTDLRAAEIGWFRLHLDVDSSLMNIPLSLNIFQRGASEIYLNGKLIHKLSKLDGFGLPRAQIP